MVEEGRKEKGKAKEKKKKKERKDKEMGGQNSASPLFKQFELLSQLTKKDSFFFFSF